MSKEALETSKKLSSTDSGLKKYIDATLGIARGGTVGNVIKIITLVLGIGFLFFAKNMMRQLKIDAAKDLSEQEKQELRKYLDGIIENTNDSSVVDLEKNF